MGESKSVPFVLKSGTREALVRVLNSLGLLGAKQSPLAFIAHGHDETAVLELKNYIQNTLSWRESIVLREQPSCGKTLGRSPSGMNLMVGPMGHSQSNREQITASLRALITSQSLRPERRNWEASEFVDNRRSGI
jgi:hypothetical protein